MLDWLFGKLPRPAPPSDAHAQLAQAYAHHQAGRLAEARAGYATLLAADPAHFDAAHMLAVLALQSGRAQEAVEFARRAVQAAAWGHPITSGLPTIDHFLSAADLEPPEGAQHYTEKLVRLPGLGVCCDPAAVVPQEMNPAALGIRDGVPLLLCAGTPYKYAPRHDGVLVEIARRLGECQLVFFESQPREMSALLRERLEHSFGQAGLKFAEFGVFVPWQSGARFRGLLAQADVLLDTIGFSGFNTALQAIGAGLPIAAWEGRYLRGRLASGILRRMGLDELVADTPQAYADIAVRLAQDAAWWGSVRERILAARAKLYGDTEPVRALERFFEQAVS